MIEVVAALIRRGEEFLICQRPAEKKRGLMWEFPGGKVDPGETHEQAVAREIREELGVEIAVGRRVDETVHRYPDVEIRLSLYECAVLSGDSLLKEHADARWIVLGEEDAFDLCPADRDFVRNLRKSQRERLLEAASSRHSVRKYRDCFIDGGVLTGLRRHAQRLGRQGGLTIRIVTDEPEAFSTPLARYGFFRGVRNYIVLSGAPSPTLPERAGYYGEELVLLAQAAGLNTCWVLATYRKSALRKSLPEGEDPVCVIALGYGETAGHPHRNRPVDKCFRAEGEAPDWFRAGADCAMLAPTALNRQKFLFEYENGTVSARATGGEATRLDLGIVKYHFELGAGKPGLLRPEK